MKMIIVSLVFSIGVLFQGVLGVDVQCFAEKDLELSAKMNSIKSLSAFCSDFKPITSEIINASKSCGFTKTDVSKLNSYVDQLCDTESDLRKKFNKSDSCLVQNNLNILPCMTVLIEIRKNAKKETLGEIYKLLCKEKVFDILFGCVDDTLGKPCGDEGLQVVKGFTDAYSTYINSICLEINGSSSLKSLSWSILMALLAIYVIWK